MTSSPLVAVRLGLVAALVLGCQDQARPGTREPSAASALASAAPVPSSAAVSDAGTLSAPPAPPGHECRTIDDCAATVNSDACCEICLARALTAKAAEALTARCRADAGPPSARCGKLDCPAERNVVDCAAGRCVMQPTSTLQIDEIAGRAELTRMKSLDDAIPDAAYRPARGERPRFSIGFQEGGTRIVIGTAADPLSGRVKRGTPAGTTVVDLGRSGVVKGRLTIVLQPDGTRRAAFTVLGPGGRLEESERGRLVDP